MQINVEELTIDQDAEVATFLDDLGRRSPAVLAYHYPFYREMIAELGVGKPLYLGARFGGELVGMLPAFVGESEIGIAYCSLPFFGPNAGVLCASGNNSDAIHEALLSHLLLRARESKAISCAVYTPFLSSDFAHYDACEPDAVVERFTQYSEIENTEWNGFIRNRLRRAERLHVNTSTENSHAKLEEFYGMYSENCKDYSIPLKPKQCLATLMSAEVLGLRTRIYYAVHEGQIIAGLLLAHSPSTVSYYIPTTRHESRNLQPGTVLIDTAFRDMRAAGVRVWNWESSPNRESGVYKYKEKWGATESGYRTYVWCFRGRDCLRKIGKERLAAEFPYFYIYPFDQL